MSVQPSMKPCDVRKPVPSAHSTGAKANAITATSVATIPVRFRKLGLNIIIILKLDGDRRRTRLVDSFLKSSVETPRLLFLSAACPKAKCGPMCKTNGKMVSLQGFLQSLVPACAEWLAAKSPRRRPFVRRSTGLPPLQIAIRRMTGARSPASGLLCGIVKANCDRTITTSYLDAVGESLHEVVI